MDEVARRYLLIGLGVGELQEGIVDSYYGPPDVREEARSLARPAAALADEAVALREDLPNAVDDAQRALWLDRQLVALETLARRLDGLELPYADEVERCFDAPPGRTPPEDYERARELLDELLPPGGSLRERLDAREQRITVPSDRLPSIVEWLTGEIRDACARVFPIPAGESLTVSMVSDQPWSAYNWYDGDLRSRIEVNTDLPKRMPDLIGLVAHEAFPGHHLEHAWKEQRLVREQGRLEASVLLINTPEAYVSEGLANLGERYVVDDDLWRDLFAGMCARAGIALSAAEIDRDRRVTETLRMLRGASGDAALLLHGEGRPREEILDFLQTAALRGPDLAAKNLEFISHPLWRTYVFCYAGGEQLLGDWCAAAGSIERQRERFLRLLTEQLTPSGIAAELAETARSV